MEQKFTYRAADSSSVGGGSELKIEQGETCISYQQDSTDRRLAELAGLVRIAKELHLLSIRERKLVQPLRDDTRRLIEHSRQLLAQSEALSQRFAETKPASQL